MTNVAPPPPPVVSASEREEKLRKWHSMEDVSEIAKDMSKDALMAAYEILNENTSEVGPNAKLKAIDLILDRGLGKAAQTVNVEVSHTEIINRIKNVDRAPELPIIDVEPE